MWGLGSIPMGKGDSGGNSGDGSGGTGEGVSKPGLLKSLSQGTWLGQCEFVVVGQTLHTPVSIVQSIPFLGDGLVP